MRLTKDFQHHFMCSKAGKYIYVSVPKSGCTSTLHALWNAEYLYLDHRTPAPNVSLHQYRNAPFARTGLYLNKNRDAPSFTVVRNPFTRAYSGYNQKRWRMTTDNISFKTFLHRLVQGSPKTTDVHFLPQVDITMADRLKYDHIVPLERWDEAFAPVYKRIFDSDYIGTEPLNVMDSGSTIEQAYDAECIDLVREYYARDFETFGYSKNFENRKLAPKPKPDAAKPLMRVADIPIDAFEKRHQPVPVFYINMESMPRRRAHMEKQLPNSRVITVEHVPAVTGEKATKTSERELSSGEVGCFQSHRKVWKKMVDCQLRHAIVMEDDLILSPDFGKFVNSLRKRNLNIDFLRLDTYTKKYMRGPRYKKLGGRTIRQITDRRYSSAAYYLTLAEANRLLAATEAIAVPIDHAIYNRHNSEKLHELWPALCIQAKVHEKLYGNPLIDIESSAIFDDRSTIFKRDNPKLHLPLRLKLVRETKRIFRKAKGIFSPPGICHYR